MFLRTFKYNDMKKRCILRVDNEHKMAIKYQVKSSSHAKRMAVCQDTVQDITGADCSPVTTRGPSVKSFNTHCTASSTEIIPGLQPAETMALV